MKEKSSDLLGEASKLSNYKDVVSLGDSLSLGWEVGEHARRAELYRVTVGWRR